MCLITKCIQKTVDKKLQDLKFPLVMWKVMKVCTRAEERYPCLVGIYAETNW